MRALVTGGAGFIGSHLTDALLEMGHRVSAIDNLSTGSADNVAHLRDHPHFQFVTDSITNEVVMDRLIGECDVIFHLAAAVGVNLIVSDPVHVIETNILGTHAILKIAARYRKKVLLASTSEIYGKNNDVPFGEEDDRLLGATTKARWAYSSSKAIDEFLGLAYHRQMGLPVVIFRLFNTVGPRQTGRYGMVAPRFVQKALRDEPLPVHGDGKQSRCFCDVEDAVRAIISLAQYDGAVGEVFNVGSRNEISILELAREVLRLVNAANSRRWGATKIDGSKGEDEGVVFVPYEDAYETGFEDMRRRVPDITKIKNAINWEPIIPLEETIRRIIEWYHVEGQAQK